MPLALCVHTIKSYLNWIKEIWYVFEKGDSQFFSIWDISNKNNHPFFPFSRIVIYKDKTIRQFLINNI